MLAIPWAIAACKLGSCETVCGSLATSTMSWPATVTDATTVGAERFVELLAATST